MASLSKTDGRRRTEREASGGGTGVGKDDGPNKGMWRIERQEIEHFGHGLKLMVALELERKMRTLRHPFLSTTT